MTFCEILRKLKKNWIDFILKFCDADKIENIEENFEKILRISDSK